MKKSEDCCTNHTSVISSSAFTFTMSDRNSQSTASSVSDSETSSTVEIRSNMDSSSRSSPLPSSSSSSNEADAKTSQSLKVSSSKAERRRMANRKASVASRLRKKIFVAELQRQVINLSNKIARCEDENRVLRQMLRERQTQKSHNARVPCNSAVITQPLPTTSVSPVLSSRDELKNRQCSSFYSTKVSDSSCCSSNPYKHHLYEKLVEDALQKYVGKP